MVTVEDLVSAKLSYGEVRMLITGGRYQNLYCRFISYQ